MIDQKMCSTCHTLLPNTVFHKQYGRKDGLQRECKLCRKKHKKTYDSYQKGYRNRQKKLVYDHYCVDGKICCATCGFSNIKALSIDHINNNGSEHRKEISKGKKYNIGSIAIYRSIINNNYPDGFQILCMNCQWIKRVDAQQAGSVA